MFLKDANKLRDVIETMFYAGKSDSNHILDVFVCSDDNRESDDSMRFMVVINDSFGY